MRKSGKLKTKQQRRTIKCRRRRELDRFIGTDRRRNKRSADADADADADAAAIKSIRVLGSEETAAALDGP